MYPKEKSIAVFPGKKRESQLSDLLALCAAEWFCPMVTGKGNEKRKIKDALKTD